MAKQRHDIGVKKRYANWLNNGGPRRRKHGGGGATGPLGYQLVGDPRPLPANYYGPPELFRDTEKPSRRSMGRRTRDEAA